MGYNCMGLIMLINKLKDTLKNKQTLHGYEFIK